MSAYYSGEDEKRKKQKEELPPKKDTSGSTFSEENIDSSDNHRIMTNIRPQKLWKQSTVKMPGVAKA